MRRPFLFVLLLPPLPSPAATQSTGTLRGSVTGTAGQAVEAAEIRIVGAGLAVLSASDGRFTLGNVPPGDHVVEIRRIGYKAQRLSARLDAGQTKEVRIILEQGAFELPELTVTARQLKPIEYGWTTRYDDVFRRMSVGLGAYVMREQIDRRGAGRTPSLLAGIRGVHLKFRHAGVSGTDVEITGCERVSVWIDGQKQRYADVPAPQRGTGRLGHAPVGNDTRAITGSHLERVLPSQIEMIEVYRGPAEMPAEFLDDSCAAIAVWTR